MIGRFRSWLQRQMYPVPENFLGRTEMPVAEIQKHHYPSTNLTDQEFADIWTEIADIFRVPSGRLRPGDQFGIELKARVTLGGSGEDLWLGSLLKRFQIESQKGLTDARSVDDVVKLAEASKSRAIL